MLLQWIIAREVFTSILQYSNNNGEPTQAPPTEQYASLTSDNLIVFCDHTRFEMDRDCDHNVEVGSACDTYTLISVPMDQNFENCQALDDSIEAWVQELTHVGHDRATTMQLCNGLLSQIYNAKYNTLQDMGSAPSLARDWAKFKSTNNIDVLPMDLAATFDLVLTHELSHAIRKPTTDLGTRGWDASYRIGSVQNADNVAFFALGADMISPKNGAQAQRPMEDGTIQVLAGFSRRERDYHNDNIPFGPRAVDLNIILTSSTSRNATVSSTVSSSRLSSSSEKSSSSSISLSKAVSSIVLPTLSTNYSSGLSTKSLSSNINSSSHRALEGQTAITASLSSRLSSSSSVSSSKSLPNTKQSTATTSTAGNYTSNHPASGLAPTSSTYTQPILVINWDKVTPITTSGVSLATHDSHGWPIIPVAHCWFCPHNEGGDTGGDAIIIPSIIGMSENPHPFFSFLSFFSSNISSGPGILPPPSPGVEPPIGLSTNMPTITLNAAGDPTFDLVEPTNQPTNSATSTTSESKSSSSSYSSSSSHSSSSCSTHISKACDMSYSMLSPTSTGTASYSTITLSCSTITACSASQSRSSTSGSSTSRPIVYTATPVYDSGKAATYWTAQQSILSKLIADKTDPYITWSSNTTYVATSRTVSGKVNSANATSTTSLTSSSQKSSVSIAKSAESKTTTEAKSKKATSSSGITAIVTSSVNSTAPVITLCSLSTYSALKSTYSKYTIDVPASIGCACNDGWIAGVGSIVGSDSSTTYTCQVTSTNIAISTAAPEPVTKTSQSAATSTESPAYQTDKCKLHIFQVSKDYMSPLYVQLNTTDRNNKLLTSKDFELKWGGTANISSGDSGVGQDVNVDFTQERQSSASRKLRPRVGGPVEAPDWQAWIVRIAVGNTEWSSKDTKTSDPYCNVGDWDNGDFADFLDGIITLGANQFSPVSSFGLVDRKFADADLNRLDRWIVTGSANYKHCFLQHG